MVKRDWDKRYRVEHLFEIQLLEATNFIPSQSDSYPAWLCLMRKRVK